MGRLRLWPGGAYSSGEQQSNQPLGSQAGATEARKCTALRATAQTGVALYRGGRESLRRKLVCSGSKDAQQFNRREVEEGGRHFQQGTEKADTATGNMALLPARHKKAPGGLLSLSHLLGGRYLVGDRA